MSTREKSKTNRSPRNLSVDVVDLVGQEGLDPGLLGEALQPPQLLQVLTQLVRRHLRCSLSYLTRAFPVSVGTGGGDWANDESAALWLR
jgi:hypothetical protein